MSELLLFLVMTSGPLLFIGFILIGVAIWGKNKYKNRTNICKTNGELVGFREVIVDTGGAYIASHGGGVGGGTRTRDYKHNVKNSRPIFNVYENGRVTRIVAEFTTRELGKRHVGSMVPIVSFKTSKRGKTKVIMDNAEHEEKLVKNPKLISRIFFAVGFIPVVLSLVLAVVTLMKW